MKAGDKLGYAPPPEVPRIVEAVASSAGSSRVSGVGASVVAATGSAAGAGELKGVSATVPPPPPVRATADQSITIGQEATAQTAVQAIAKQTIDVGGPTYEINGGPVTVTRTQTVSPELLKNGQSWSDHAVQLEGIAERDITLEGVVHRETTLQGILEATEAADTLSAGVIVRSPAEIDAVARRLLGNPKLFAGVLRQASDDMRAAIIHGRANKPNDPEKLDAYEQQMATVAKWQFDLNEAAGELEKPQPTLSRGRKVAKVLVSILDEMVDHCSDMAKPIAKLMANTGIAATVAGLLFCAINLPTKATFWTSFGVLQAATIAHAVKKNGRTPTPKAPKPKSKSEPKPRTKR